ncbi:MAG: sensor histidine kinase [Campylobacterota bacterium]
MNSLEDMDAPQLRERCKKLQKQLERIIQHSDKQDERLRRANEELSQYKNHLEHKVQQEIKRREEKEKMLYQQSKLAAMGEMINAIAHQWKQPINVLKMQIEMLGLECDETCDPETIREFTSKSNTQIEHMLLTMEEFRSFFKPNKSTHTFYLKDAVESVLRLMKDELMKHQIHTVITAKTPLQIEGIENEFKHLLLNLINNAKDAFEENEIENKELEFIIEENQMHKRLVVKDNAGGIDSSVLDSLFKPNVTTKSEDRGSGIGLYLSSQIAYKHNAKLYAKNHENGACFVFEKVVP